MGLDKIRDASIDFLKAVVLIEEIRHRKKMEPWKLYSTSREHKAYQGLVATIVERTMRREKKDPNFTPYGKNLLSSAFYFSESAKARKLLEGIANSRSKIESPEIPLKLREKEKMLGSILTLLDKNNEEAFKKGEKAFSYHQERYKKTKTEMDDLIAKLRKEYPKYAALMYPQPFKVEDLPLRTDEVLLEYTVADNATYLFKVSKGKVERIFKIPLKKEEIEILVNEFMIPLQSEVGSRKEEFSSVKGNKLFNLLLADALKDISPEKKIIIVPDGILGVLPFEALVTKMGKDYQDSIYVGDKWTITYSQSATVLALNRLLKISQAHKPLFALGNPFYSKDDPRYLAHKKGKPQPILLAQDMGRSSFSGLATRREWGQVTKDEKNVKPLVYNPLPETESEVTEIARLFYTHPTPPDILLGINANETSFKQTSLKDYRYLHFATHGDLPGKVQGINEPFLLLGQVENKGEDNGFLTLSKVLGLKLDADMVVLSACMTGRGKVVEGEGVMNFARAFQHSGARSVVVSLWEVASKVTVEFMTTFYRHLKDGKPRAEALSLTRTEIKKKYPNPYFWAPFVLYGEK